MACFLALDVLRARYGDDIPYAGALDRGFAFRGLPRVPFLNYQKGIYRAAAQRGPAALSIQTSAKSPYGDEETDDGFLYAYRAGAADQPDNRALRAASELAVPLVYFVATRPGVYRALYPWYVEDLPEERRVHVGPGRMIGPLDEREPVAIDEPLARRYAVREVRVRLHQARFRALVLPAYRERCAVCRLHETRLLDAAHIARDADPRGLPVISNGLSLCSIHHRAYDEDLVAVSPDYRVHVATRLLEDEDGPMLDLLKGFEGSPIELPRRGAWQPDRELLAERFDRFRNAA
jgi:putative restriction endonuclease